MFLSLFSSLQCRVSLTGQAALPNFGHSNIWFESVSGPKTPTSHKIYNYNVSVLSTPSQIQPRYICRSTSVLLV